MAITLTKDLPSSDWYSGSGSTTITLAGATEMTFNTKKQLIKIQIPESPSSQASNPSDKAKSYIKDLKKVEDSFKIRGWIEDDETTSAWEKMWKLRAMASSGGPVELTIEDKTFNSSTQEVYLEEVTSIAHPSTTLGLKINETSSSSINKARIEVDLSFYLGDER